MQAEWVTFGSHSEDAIFWLTKTLIFDSICYFPTCLEFPSEYRIWLGSSNIFLQGRGRQLECNGEGQNSSLSLGGLLFLLIFWKYSVFHFEYWARKTGGDFVLQGTFDSVWRHFWWWWWGATDILWVEARDTAKCPTAHRTTPMTKSYVAQNINSAEVEKPWLGVCFLFH